VVFPEVLNIDVDELTDSEAGIVHRREDRVVTLGKVVRAQTEQTATAAPGDGFVWRGKAFADYSTSSSELLSTQSSRVLFCFRSSESGSRL